MADTHSLFDLVLTGQLAQGIERAGALAQLALLFKMPVEKVDAMVASAPVVLKRDLAWDVAKRYRVAIKQAGALSDIRPSESGRAEAAAPRQADSPTLPTAVEETVTTPVWSVAAVGADVLTPQERSNTESRLAQFRDFSLRPSEGNLLDGSEMAPPITAHIQPAAGLEILPPGSAVLAEHERALPLVAMVTAPQYDIAALGERLSNPVNSTVTAPDTAHLSLIKP